MPPVKSKERAAAKKPKFPEPRAPFWWHPHPKVEGRRAKGTPAENTAYYWWFKFLMMSSKYRDCCENGGAGECADLYVDFGDIYKVDFETWWQTKGEYLFGDLGMPYRPHVFGNPHDIDPAWLLDGCALILLPLYLGKETLISSVGRRLDEAYESLGTDHPRRKSKARYPLEGRYETGSLRRLSEAYAWYLNEQERRQNGNKKISYAKMIDSISDSKRKSVEPESMTAAEKTREANRLIDKAERLIKNIEQGKFPKFD